MRCWNRWGFGASRAMMTAAEAGASEYERAVAALNSLQTNAAVLEAIRKSGKPRKSFELVRMQRYLERTGLRVEELDRLNIIHVTGTKGKGSVSSMCESILRAHGLKTGFYSSPHLLEVRERIRINSRPLSKPDFISTFWTCLKKLEASESSGEPDMPSYFRMLTVMAFHVFLKEKVDVAVVEVGIGGTFDSTNVLQHPAVCAITSLGYDHTELLGNSLEQIAWQKGGICKPGCPVFTVPQPAQALKMLGERAQELKASSIHVVPDLSLYPGARPDLGLHGRHQWLNSSLAIQVCRKWLQRTGRWHSGDVTSPSPPAQLLEGLPIADVFPLSPEFYTGLQSCKWAGRNQTIHKEGITFYLDGAHTPDSVKSSAEWFKEAATAEERAISGPVVRALLFNITRNRDPYVMLSHLTGCGFHYALFSPNITNLETANSVDQTNLTVTMETQLASTAANEEAWIRLSSSTNQMGSASHVTKQSCSFQSVQQALDWLTSLPPSSPPPLPQATHIQLLVTGSLHLVGAVMSVLGYTSEHT